MSKLLGDIEEALADAEWLAGNRLTLADIGMTPFVVRMEQLGMTTMFHERPKLAAWLARVKARPSYAEAMGKWFNPDYLTLSERGPRRRAADRGHNFSNIFGWDGG